MADIAGISMKDTFARAIFIATTLVSETGEATTVLRPPFAALVVPASIRLAVSASRLGGPIRPAPYAITKTTEEAGRTKRSRAPPTTAPNVAATRPPALIAGAALLRRQTRICTRRRVEAGLLKALRPASLLAASGRRRVVAVGLSPSLFMATIGLRPRPSTSVTLPPNGLNPLTSARTVTVVVGPSATAILIAFSDIAAAIYSFVVITSINAPPAIVPTSPRLWPPSTSPSGRETCGQIIVRPTRRPNVVVRLAPEVGRRLTMTTKLPWRPRARHTAASPLSHI